MKVYVMEEYDTLLEDSHLIGVCDDVNKVNDFIDKYYNNENKLISTTKHNGHGLEYSNKYLIAEGEYNYESEIIITVYSFIINQI